MQRILIISLVLYALCMTSISCQQQSNVLAFNSNQFNTQLKNVPIAMVAFYAPWCHYSQMLLPEFDTASAIVKFLPDVSLIKVDCYDQASKDTCKSQNVNGYPTIKIFKYGRFYKMYDGPRKSFEILNYIFGLEDGTN